MRLLLLLAAMLSAAVMGCVYHKDHRSGGPSHGTSVAGTSLANGAATSGMPGQDYFVTLGKILDPVATATANWTATADRIASVDSSALSSGEAIALLREELDLAKKLQVAAAGATVAIRRVTVPAKCSDTQVQLLEALQLTEQGALEFKTYLEAALHPGNLDDSQRRYANELFARADRAKQRAMLSANRDGCQRP